MAYGVIVENREMSDDSAQQVFEHVRSTGPVPPEGCRLMLAGPADPGTRIVSVWDSQEALQRFFAERLEPAYAAAGLSLDRIARTLFEVHTLVAGDLTGAPQPA
jgi:hypothetical protein